MQLEKIWSKQDFNAVYRIMEQSFPKCERRTYEKACELLLNPGYHVYAVREKSGGICGFIASWNFDGFRFVEHFAISENMRSNGIGSKMMGKYMTLSRFPVCLEVEAADTETAKRRIGFYRRLGFILNDYGYIQPNLQDSDRKVLLKIMSYPYGLRKPEFLMLKEVLRTQVYGMKRKGNPHT